MKKAQERPGIMGYCNHHEMNVDEETLGARGCWNCHYFRLNSKYKDVYGARLTLGVSESTIRRWIRIGKLKGYLCINYGVRFFSPRKYLVAVRSLERIKRI